MRIKHKATNSTTDFLSALTLLSHDPDLLGDVLPQAKAGNVHAQYAAGLIYAEGRGVEPDRVEAYVWLSRALGLGDQDAGLLRSMLLASMSTEEIARAELKLVAEVLQ
jgi:TPR repeat protein